MGSHHAATGSRGLLAGLILVWGARPDEGRWGEADRGGPELLH
jgi:hypothetical protein